MSAQLNGRDHCNGNVAPTNGNRDQQEKAQIFSHGTPASDLGDR